MPELGERVVVLGASMGGLLAARVLADFYRTVDVDDVFGALDTGDVDTALSHYGGPLPPQSVSPAIARLRTQLGTVRGAVLLTGNEILLRRWLESPVARDDRDGRRALHDSAYVRSPARRHQRRVRPDGARPDRRTDRHRLPLAPSRGHFDQRIRAPVSCRVGVRYAKGLGSTSVAENHPHRRRLTGTRVAPGSNPRE